jgi:DNA-binding transcriptional regulator YdaS (Cro superfamily)
MATVFDGDNLIITLDTPVSGVLDLDIPRLYSEWKEWQTTSFQNMGYPPAFRTVGGDAINATTAGVPSFFLQNQYGWRLRPFEADHTINIQGQLGGEDPTLPLSVPTIGAYTVIGFNIQPVAQVVSSGVTLAAGEVTAIESAIFSHVVEASLTFDEVLRLIGAMAAGTIEQGTDGSYTIRGLDGSTGRILGQLGANNGRDITSVNAA